MYIYVMRADVRQCTCPVFYRVAKAAQRAERSEVLNEVKKVAISEKLGGFLYSICG